MSTTNPTEQPNEKQGALHTPGPWTAAITDDGAEVFLDDNGPGRAVIAEIKAQPEYASNALLIAAAPDLLAAARAVVAASESMCQGDVLNTLPLEIAIAKAEGR